MTLNLEDYVGKEVLVTYRDDDTIVKGVIEKNYLDTPFPFIFRCFKTGSRHSYTKNGQFYLSKQSQIDIVKIQLAEPEMTEPNYKELAEKFYNAIKENTYTRGNVKYNELLKEYERVTRPKMISLGYSSFEKVVYNNKDYAIVGGYCYRIRDGRLYLLEDETFTNELSIAYIDRRKI